MSGEEKPSPSKDSTATGSSDAPAADADAATTIMEYNVRVVNNGPKKHHIMRFNEMEKVDFTKWRDVTMEREDNWMEFSGGAVDNMPKYGEGSEYNRDNREAARRRRKYGTTKDKKYRPEDQPWLLNVGGKNGKKYKGRREGGVNANSVYYIMKEAADGTKELHPVHEWYNFQPIQRHKSLTAEEAEQEFEQRNETMDYFSLMFRNRLKRVEEEQENAELDKDDDDDDYDDDDDDDDDDDEAKIDGGGDGDGEKVKDEEIELPEMEEWMLDSDEQSKSEDEDDNKAKKVNKINDKKKTKEGDNDDDDEAFDESDDGDEEGKELDYGTESSEGELDPDEKCIKDLKGVSEEEEDEDDSNSDDSEKENEKEKKGKNIKNEKKNKRQDNVDDVSDGSDSGDDIKKRKSKKKSKNTRNVQRKRKSNRTPGGNDATAAENTKSPSAKKTKQEVAAASLPATFAGVVKENKDCGITEAAVRRYLMRKPMTAKKLLRKFKKKKGSVSKEQLLETISRILKKINPTQQTIRGKLYLSIKDDDKKNKK